MGGALGGPGQGPHEGQNDGGWGQPQPGEATWGGQLGGEQPSGAPPGSHPRGVPCPQPYGAPPPSQPGVGPHGQPGVGAPGQAGAPPPGQPPYDPTRPYGPPAPAPGQPGAAGKPGGSGKLPVLLFAGVASVLALALIGVLLVALVGDDSEGRATFDDPAARRAKAASKELVDAAFTLAGAPAVRYEGSYVNGAGDEVPTTARLTSGGWLLADVETEDGTAKVLSNGARTYLKADKSYWKRNGAPSDSLGEYGKQWVKIRGDIHLGIDLRLLLAPGLLGANLAAAVDRGEVSGGEITTLDEVKVREVVTPAATVYISTADPKRIVRVTHRKSGASPDPSPSGSGQGGSGGSSFGDGDEGHGGRIAPAYRPADREFEFDLAGMSADDAAALVKEFRKRVGELKNSIDSEVDFSLDSQGTLKPCGNSACTANITVRNEVSSGADYLEVKQPVHALVTITMLLDDRKIKTCKQTKKMDPNTKATFRCRATYTLSPGQHEIRARMKAVAKATVGADLKKLFDDIKQELERAEDGEIPWERHKEGDLGSGWEPCDPTEVANDRRDCADRAKEIQGKIGGEVKTIKPYPRIGTTKLGPYNGYHPNWATYEVVVRDGRVYDAWTSRHGELIDTYKQRWAWADMLRFDF